MLYDCYSTTVRHLSRKSCIEVAEKSFLNYENTLNLYLKEFLQFNFFLKTIQFKRKSRALRLRVIC